MSQKELAGYYAARDNKSMDSNPYVEDSDSWHEWRNGYLEYMSEMY